MCVECAFYRVSCTCVDIARCVYDRRNKPMSSDNYIWSFSHLARIYCRMKVYKFISKLCILEHQYV